MVAGSTYAWTISKTNENKGVLVKGVNYESV